MKRHCTTLLALVLTTGSLFAQSAKLEKANKLFDQYAYTRAITAYEDVLKKETTNKVAQLRLGDCYRLTQDFGIQSFHR